MKKSIFRVNTPPPAIKSSNKRGFSLVELIVVIAIMAVFLAVLVPSVLNYVDHSKVQKDESAESELVNAVNLAMSDSQIFDEVYSYCVPNNYVTYTDSSGKYSSQIVDQEYWAPDGAGAAVTVTFNPEGKHYNIAHGIVNDMTYGNGSRATPRTAEGELKQGYLEELPYLYGRVKQVVGDQLGISSNTYRNSSYTVFIRFDTKDNTKVSSVYGLYNGTNLSEECQVSNGSGTSNYDTQKKPVSTVTGGIKTHNKDNFTASDLGGSGSVTAGGSSRPSYKPCSHDSVTMIDENTHKCDIEDCQKVLEHIINPETEKCACGYHVHRYPETGLTAKCEICGKIKNHTCFYVNNICKYCGEEKVYDFEVTSSNRRILGYTGVEGENLVIPATFIGDGTNGTVNGRKYKVTSIDSYAFASCSRLTSINIPDSVTYIDNWAFQNCTSLTSIIIPNSVTSIGYRDFYGCTSLTSITIPDSVTIIGGEAFKGCTSLTSINIPNGVTSIGYGAFQKCPITSINIPDGVTSIGEMAFASCSRLTSINIPDSVTSIGSGAFGWCDSLTSITIPDSVTSIGRLAFKGCTSLTSITIGNGVTSIGEEAFYNCTSLTSITIPNSVTSIEKEAFKGCTSLTSVTIGNSVTSIDQYAFSSCTSLTSITIPDSVTSIGYAAFWNCTSLTSITIQDGVTSTGDSAFKDCTSLTSITIPNSVTSIGSEAFSGCTSLTSITIPDGVTSIGDCAFYNCTSLKSITIPKGVTSIGDSAFNRCTSLTSITIPDSVTSIEYKTFYWCSRLKSITIGNGVTSIGGYAFYYCESLTSINIPDSVTSIGQSAFQYCRSLTSVTYTGTQAQWNTITKGSDWKYYVPSSCIIHCTDGNITIANAG